MSDRWVDGDLEAGADDEGATPAASEETGAFLGEGEASSFEPEEDEVAPDSTTP